jgi:hypothetical protein
MSESSDWYLHDGTAWTTGNGTDSTGLTEPGPPREVHSSRRTTLRFRPLWQWAALGVLAFAVTLAWLLAAAGTGALPCH